MSATRVKRVVLIEGGSGKEKKRRHVVNAEAGAASHCIVDDFRRNSFANAARSHHTATDSHVYNRHKSKERTMRGLRLGGLLLASSVLCLCSLVAVGSLFGDDKKPDTKEPEPKARGILPKYYKSLGLSDDQKQAIYKLQGTYTAKIDTLQKQIKDLKAEEAVAVEKLLTKAQLDRLGELKAGDKDKPAADKAPEKVTDKPAEKPVEKDKVEKVKDKS
jgi:hypothetical protein